jgi:hypothetical protein
VNRFGKKGTVHEIPGIDNSSEEHIVKEDFKDAGSELDLTGEGHVSAMIGTGSRHGEADNAGVVVTKSYRISRS